MQTTDKTLIEEVIDLIRSYRRQNSKPGVILTVDALIEDLEDATITSPFIY